VFLESAAILVSRTFSREELEKRVKNLEAELGQCRHAEQELRKSQYYLDRITRGMYESLLVLDRNLIIQDVNERFLQEYGAVREKVIGRTCHEVTHRSDRPCSSAKHQCPVREVLETGEPTRAEHLHTGKDGEELIIEIYAFPLFGDDGRIENIVEVHHDVTDRRRAEQEQARRERLEGVLEMAGAVCHELNQPLTVLSLYCNQLLEGNAEEDHLNNHMRYVLDKVHRMGAITKKLQKITRYETKDYVSGKKIVDIDKASQPG
jgi:PAS domain S-box-containing protein